jgi:hypothetical protein
MDISKRKWWVKLGDDEEGPLMEEAFQERLRSGHISLRALIKSNFMEKWEPLLSYISADETFRRPSTTPPPDPAPSADKPGS